MTPTVPLSVSEEHRYWLAILEDHARFLLERLAPGETEWRNDAARAAAGFASLREHLDTLPLPSKAGAPEWIAFAKTAHQRAAGYYQLEGRLQARLLAGSVELRLPPSFLNSTLNENQEYLRLLRYYVQGADAPPLPLWNLMDLWLDDQLGHACLLQELAGEDENAAAIVREAARAAEEFRSHLIRNKAINGYLRFTPPGFPEQLAAAEEAAGSVNRFVSAIRRALSLPSLPLPAPTPSPTSASAPAGSRGSAGEPSFLFRFLGHQLPESDYFLRKLSEWLPAEDRPLAI